VQASRAIVEREAARTQCAFGRQTGNTGAHNHHV
jgi:hypothetical protein